MKNKKIKFIYILVIFEIFTIAFIGFQIYDKKRGNVLGAKIVSIINKDTIEYPKESEYKYYYEHQADTKLQDKTDWMDQPVEYSFNNDALNERFNYQIYKNPNAYRIITLGDSHTFGQYVNTEDNWPEKLEDMLNFNKPCSKYDKYEVINLGEEGYDAAYSAYRYNKRGKKYNPDLILWMLTTDDLTAVNEISYQFIEYYNKTLSPTEKQTATENGQYYLYLMKAKDLMYKEYGTENLLKFEMDSVYQFLKIYKNPLVFFILNPVDDSFEKYIKPLSETRNDIYYYDGLQDLYKKRLLLKDGHPNKEGYEFLTGKIYNYLRSYSIISCN